MLDAVVGLGSNLGDSFGTFAVAARELSRLGAIDAYSALYRTAPLGPPQPDYLNAAVRLRTSSSPLELLRSLLAVEAKLGRVRRERWGPRALDLDLLWIAGLAVDTPELQVPHPELELRSFALAPLLDVAPEARSPLGGPAYADLLAALPEAGLARLATPFPRAFSDE